MAYDFSNIRSIIKSDGTELQKITDTNGNIVWQKLYVWEKFNCNQVSTGYKYTKTRTTLEYPTRGDMYTSISFDSSIGDFTLSGRSGTWMGLDYWEVIKEAYDVDSLYPYSDGWKYFKSGHYFYELRAAITRPYSGSASVYRYDVSESLSYSQGSTSYGYVTSTSPSAYPANGRYSSDGYWYVKIA